LSNEFNRTFPFASDKIIWQGAQDLQFCRDQFPITTKRWGLCATAGAYHKAHTDTEGEGTFIRPDSGVKIWIIGVPKKSRAEYHRDFDQDGDIKYYLKHFDLDSTNGDRWKWQAVVLKPGMELWVISIIAVHTLTNPRSRIMRPNTVHVVFTAEHSVCRGGHYYATSTLRDTCYGIIHTFAAGSMTTNSSHSQDSFMSLTYMLAYFHSQFIDSEGEIKVLKTGTNRNTIPNLQ
jgi:hypothetical protein